MPCHSHAVIAQWELSSARGVARRDMWELLTTRSHVPAGPAPRSAAIAATIVSRR